MSIKLQRTRKIVSELNRAYHSRKLLDARFYRQLERQGIDVSGSVLVDLVPDGGDTYFGEIILRDGRMLSFDIDLNDAQYAEWDDKSEELNRTKARFAHSRPWLPKLVALELWMARRRAET